MAPASLGAEHATARAVLRLNAVAAQEPVEVRASLQGSRASLQGSYASLQGSYASLQGSCASLQGSCASLQGSCASLQGVVREPPRVVREPPRVVREPPRCARTSPMCASLPDVPGGPLRAHRKVSLGWEDGLTRVLPSMRGALLRNAQTKTTRFFLVTFELLRTGDVSLTATRCRARPHNRPLARPGRAGPRDHATRAAAATTARLPIASLRAGWPGGQSRGQIVHGPGTVTNGSGRAMFGRVRRGGVGTRRTLLQQVEPMHGR
jgi:hypothetical protein